MWLRLGGGWTFHDCLGEVSGSIYIYAVGQRHEVREQLQGDDFRNGKQVLGGRFDENAIAHQGRDFFIAGVGNGNDPSALSPHIAQ